ncbi:hypothetical protein [Saccharopolyspora hattusasensis]|uniref:hypothetical protein n=1 Tax=Saccharopolyspora hattusasensis TaxID=1128679 RepID=UPI003D999E34
MATFSASTAVEASWLLPVKGDRSGLHQQLKTRPWTRVRLGGYDPASSIEVEPSISMELAERRRVAPRHADACGQPPQFQWKSWAGAGAGTPGSAARSPAAWKILVLEENLRTELLGARQAIHIRRWRRPDCKAAGIETVDYLTALPST